MFRAESQWKMTGAGRRQRTVDEMRIRRFRYSLSDVQRATLIHRLCEGMREIGLLLFAFVPLDYVMQSGRVSLGGIRMLLGAAAVLYTLSLFFELRAQR
jgi:hypothetical protein